MPNITSKKRYADKCGNDKCGTFATDHHMHPNQGGCAMPGSGVAHSSFVDCAYPQQAKGKGAGHPHPASAKAHLHGGKAVPHHSAYKGGDRDGDGY